MEIKEQELLSVDDFARYLETNRTWVVFDGVQKFKSIRRAVKRGHMDITGRIYPDKPYNNRKNTSTRRGVESRVTNTLKKQIYGELIKHRK
jgi:hypothetical protein